MEEVFEIRVERCRLDRVGLASGPKCPTALAALTFLTLHPRLDITKQIPTISTSMHSHARLRIRRRYVHEQVGCSHGSTRSLCLDISITDIPQH